jgi:hypothetical protein
MEEVHGTFAPPRQVSKMTRIQQASLEGECPLGTNLQVLFLEQMSSVSNSHTSSVAPNYEHGSQWTPELGSWHSHFVRVIDQPNLHQFRA